MSNSYPYIPETPIPELKHEEFNGAKFGYMLWPSAQEITKGRIFIVHGFGEYTKIHYRLMDQLALNGYESFTFDQRGSGVTSPGKLRGLTNEYHTFNDLEHFLSSNIKECENLNRPIYLWGHSMGGGIILSYSVKGKLRDKIDGFIGSGPLLVLHPHTKPNKVTKIISPLLAKTLPNFRIDTGVDPDGLTTDQRYRDFIVNDPMSVPFYGSFKQIYDFMERGEELYNNKNSIVTKNYNINKPIIIFHGEDDTINDPKGSIKFIETIKANDKELKLYPKMRHSLFSLETDEHFALVMKDLINWLELHSKK